MDGAPIVHFDFNTLLGTHVFALMLIFCRVGACFMMFPGIGEATVPPRARLLLAFAVSFVLMPTLGPLLPPQPDQVPELIILIFGELLVGIFCGVMMRALLSTLDTAGMIISIQLGISSAAIFNPTLATQGSLPGSLLSMVGLVLIFLTNAHHAMLRGLAGSYMIFQPGHVFMMKDYSQSIALILTKSFTVAAELAAPFIVIGLAFQCTLGLIARLLPQLQVFFLVLPVQILGGLFTFAITLSALMMFWLSQMPDFLPGLFVTGG